MEAKKIFFLLSNRMFAKDGLRSTLGLAVENHYSYAVIMNGEFPPFSDYVKENIEYLKDLEGDAFTCGADAPEGVELTSITIEELGEKLREADFIIPYGLPKQSQTPPPACSE